MVLCVGAEERVWLDLNVQVKVARVGALHPLATLTRHPQLLAVDHPFRNAHLNAMWNAMRDTAFIVFRNAQVEIDLGAVKRLIERNAHHRFVIRPGNRPFPAARATAAASARASRQAGQQIGEVDVIEGGLAHLIERAASTKIRGEMLAPVRRRTKFLTGGVAAELIECSALL